MTGSVRSRVLDRLRRPTDEDGPADVDAADVDAGADTDLDAGADTDLDATATGGGARIGGPVVLTKPSAPRAPARRRFTVPVELAVLAVLAALTRLVAIVHPRGIVFDEVYFQEYALHYLDGTYYFDLHPPLGKLLLGGWASLFGVTATQQSTTDALVVMRLLPALAGVALVLTFYLFMRELTASRKVATFGAALLLLDNAILVESRLILMDSMLLLFGIGAVTCYLVAHRYAGRTHWIFLTAAAILAGMAASTKWTGLAAIGLIGLVWFARVVRNRVGWRRALLQGAILVVVPALLYLGSFAIHFALLPNSGPGDAYMSERYQSTLVGNASYDPAAEMSFPARFIEINQAIHTYELSLNESTHPYSSTWLSWPVMERGIYYWNAPAGAGTQEYIYLLGNPVIWWGLLLGVVVVALGWMRRPDLFAPYGSVMALLGVAWAANFLPFSTIVRPMFLYHYFFSFMFCAAAVSIGVGLLAGWMTDSAGTTDPVDTRTAWRFPSRPSAALYVGLLVVVLAGFLYFAPTSYATPLTDGGLTDRFWLGTWR